MARSSETIVRGIKLALSPFESVVGTMLPQLSAVIVTLRSLPRIRVARFP